jgi:hypothetical protein
VELNFTLLMLLLLGVASICNSIRISNIEETNIVKDALKDKKIRRKEKKKK